MVMVKISNLNSLLSNLDRQIDPVSSEVLVDLDEKLRSMYA